MVSINSGCRIADCKANRGPDFLCVDGECATVGCDDDEGVCLRLGGSDFRCRYARDAFRCMRFCEEDADCGNGISCTPEYLCGQSCLLLLGHDNSR